MTTSINWRKQSCVLAAALATTAVAACGSPPPPAAPEPKHDSGLEQKIVSARVESVRSCPRFTQASIECIRSIRPVRADEPSECKFLSNDGQWKELTSSMEGDGKTCETQSACRQVIDEADRQFHTITEQSLHGPIPSRGCYEDLIKTNLAANTRLRDDAHWAAEAKRLQDEADAKKLAEEKKRAEEEAKARQLAQATLWASFNPNDCARPKTLDACEKAEQYLSKYPDGEHAAEAKKAIADGAKALDALKKAEARRVAAEEEKRKNDPANKMACTSACKEKIAGTCCMQKRSDLGCGGDRDDLIACLNWGNEVCGCDKYGNPKK